MNEYEFIQQVALIVTNYNCRTVMIDYENKLINIEGPEEAQIDCAIAVEEFMNSIEYIEIEEVKTGIQTLKKDHGWMI